MTQPLRSSPDSSYPTGSADHGGAQPGRWSGRRLARRTIGAGAAVLVAGSALAVGLQAATPDQVQAPVPATSGADSPTTSLVPAPSEPARDSDEDDDEGDDEGDEEAGAPVAKVAPVRAAPVSTPAAAPVASSGGSGG